MLGRSKSQATIDLKSNILLSKFLFYPQFLCTSGVHGKFESCVSLGFNGKLLGKAQHKRKINIKTSGECFLIRAAWEPNDLRWKKVKHEKIENDCGFIDKRKKTWDSLLVQNAQNTFKNCCFFQIYVQLYSLYLLATKSNWSKALHFKQKTKFETVKRQNLTWVILSR